MQRNPWIALGAALLLTTLVACGPSEPENPPVPPPPQPESTR
jgi:hypothetical protein